MNSDNLPRLMITFTVCAVFLMVGVRYLITDSPPDAIISGLISSIVIALISTAAVTAQKKHPGQDPPPPKEVDPKT